MIDNYNRKIYVALTVAVMPNGTQYVLQESIGGQVFYFTSNSEWDPDVNNRMNFSSVGAAETALRTYILLDMVNSSQDFHFESPE